jgi:DNA-binding ferritin-like protein (Dps family)
VKEEKMKRDLREMLNELDSPMWIHKRTPLREKLDTEYEFMGQGSDRIVWRISKTRVVKIAKTERGIKQLANEASVDGKKYRDVIARVIEAHRFWLVMEYVDLRKRITRTLYNDTRVKKLIEEYDLAPGDVHNRDHWGVVGKREVLVDYGYTYALVYE